mmetsp:Transcript_21774/g.75123  ORF Transcript_21774/g.75123 Transcript_21774/m.75123 type:complete len:128 (+) Transcript_21774:156-539(+)
MVERKHTHGKQSGQPGPSPSSNLSLFMRVGRNLLDVTHSLDTLALLRRLQVIISRIYSRNYCETATNSTFIDVSNYIHFDSNRNLHPWREGSTRDFSRGFLNAFNVFARLFRMNLTGENTCYKVIFF